MDLGANVLVVVALIIAVYLSRRASLPAMNQRNETTQGIDSQDNSVESRMRESDRQLVTFKENYA